MIKYELILNWDLSEQFINSGPLINFKYEDKKLNTDEKIEWISYNVIPCINVFL